MGFFSSTPKKCGLHGKYLPCPKCTRSDTTNNKSKVKKPVTRAGKTVIRTVTVNNGSKKDSKGNDWCSCGNLIINGKCTSFLCGKKY